MQHAGDGLEHGSDGWRLIAALRPQFPDWVVDKMGASIFAGTNLAAQLKAVWEAYHIAVQIESGQIDHTPALYVIDQQGREQKLYLPQMA